MATIGDGFKDIFLAGVGAMAITGEKATNLVSTLIAKGELTVEQGKQINTELAHKAANAAESARFDALEARMSVMTPEEREAFAAKAAEIAARPAAQPVQEQPQADGLPGALPSRLKHPPSNRGRVLSWPTTRC